MSSNGKLARQIVKLAEKMNICCETIKESRDGCSNCPMKIYCLDETSYNDFGYEVPTSAVEEMLDYADYIAGLDPEHF